MKMKGDFECGKENATKWVPYKDLKQTLEN